MTPSKRAKQLGLNSLVPIIENTELSRQTLQRLVRTKPMLFELIIIGYLTKYKTKENYSSNKAFQIDIKTVQINE